MTSQYKYYNDTIGDVYSSEYFSCSNSDKIYLLFITDEIYLLLLSKLDRNY